MTIIGHAILAILATSAITASELIAPGGVIPILLALAGTIGMLFVRSPLTVLAGEIPPRMSLAFGAIAISCTSIAKMAGVAGHWYAIALAALGGTLALFSRGSTVEKRPPGPGASSGALALVVLMLVIGACPEPSPKPSPGIGQRIANCASDAVKQNWPSVLPAVNSCLTVPSWEACLIGLVNPSVGVGEDVIACLVRRQGSEFAAAAQANPGDERSAIAAQRAREFLSKHAYTFTE